MWSMHPWDCPWCEASEMGGIVQGRYGSMRWAEGVRVILHCAFHPTRQFGIARSLIDSVRESEREKGEWEREREGDAIKRLPRIVGSLRQETASKGQRERDKSGRRQAVIILAICSQASSLVSLLRAETIMIKWRRWGERVQLKVRLHGAQILNVKRRANSEMVRRTKSCEQNKIRRSNLALWDFCACAKFSAALAWCSNKSLQMGAYMGRRWQQQHEFQIAKIVVVHRHKSRISAQKSGIYSDPK